MPPGPCPFTLDRRIPPLIGPGPSASPIVMSPPALRDWVNFLAMPCRSRLFPPQKTIKNDSALVLSLSLSRDPSKRSGPFAN